MSSFGRQFRDRDRKTDECLHLEDNFVRKADKCLHVVDTFVAMTEKQTNVFIWKTLCTQDATLERPPNVVKMSPISN